MQHLADLPDRLREHTGQYQEKTRDRLHFGRAVAGESTHFVRQLLGGHRRWGWNVPGATERAIVGSEDDQRVAYVADVAPTVRYV